MTEEDDETLERIEKKVDKIQSDVNINTSMNKMLNKDELVEHFLTRMSSDLRRKIWYHSKERVTVSDLADKIPGSSKSSLYNILPKMNNDGLLNVERDGNKKFYFRNPTTEDIGLARKIRNEVDGL